MDVPYANATATVAHANAASTTTAAARWQRLSPTFFQPWHLATSGFC